MRSFSTWVDDFQKMIIFKWINEDEAEEGMKTTSGQWIIQRGTKYLWRHVCSNESSSLHSWICCWPGLWRQGRTTQMSPGAAAAGVICYFGVSGNLFFYVYPSGVWTHRSCGWDKLQQYLKELLQNTPASAKCPFNDKEKKCFKTLFWDILELKLFFHSLILCVVNGDST